MSEDNVIVKVKQGYLRGSKDVTSSGHIYYSFRGVPYAKPPVGPLRFKAPQPPESWKGTRDATNDGPPSPQLEFMKSKFKGSEDCLYLNMYTPQLPVENHQPMKAVYVWLYWGSFTIGDCSKSSLPPDFFLENDVILVIFNYRLGPLGFLSTEDCEVPGNNGLKDQVMALRWVQENIAQFGGDSNNVTFGGGSSGGACVNYHLFSPMSKGLFHRAIIQSGTIMSSWAHLKTSARKRACKLGEVLGCKTLNSKKLVEFLRTVPVEKLIRAADKAQDITERYRGHPLFRPTVEPVNGHEEETEVFLAEDPLELMKKGKFHKVPLLIGYTDREGIYMCQEFANRPIHECLVNTSFETIVLQTIFNRPSPEKLRTITRSVRSFYFGNKILSRDNIWEEYADMETDIQTLHGIYKLIDCFLKHSSHPVYLYQFSFDGKLAYYKPLIGLKNITGVCHADDIGYMFPLSNMEKKLEPESPEFRVRNRYIKLLTNFVKTGNPTPNEDTLLNVLWKPVTTEDMFYLDINSELRLLKDPRKEAMDAWKEIDNIIEH